MKAGKTFNLELDILNAVERYMQSENLTSESEAVERLLNEALIKKGHIKNNKKEGGN